MAKRGTADRAVQQILAAADESVPAPPHTLEARLTRGPLAAIWTAGHTAEHRSDNSEKLEYAVISVGALTMGGAGKSPFVAHLAQKLVAAGRNPAILTRGYGRKSRLDVIVPRGGSAPVEQTGDEAQVYIRQAAAHVGIGADRYEVGRRMERELHPDVFLLDDGFQHFRLQRDRNIVLIDALDPLGGGVFPLGRLREPFAALARATAVVITRAENRQTGIEKLIRRYNSHAPIFRARVVPQGELPAGPVAAFCGLGQPRTFWRTLEILGIKAAPRLVFRDHHRYTAADLEEISRQAMDAGAQALVTTEKDMMNLPAGAALPLKIYCLRIGIEIENEAELLQHLLYTGMRRAIFGGTFDPIHRAHLVVAREAADAFSLDQVLFIPAANPPHKEAGTPYEHRYKMVELACKEDPRFSPSRLEEEARKSYSIYTIELVKAMGGDVFFVIGADAFAEIQTWFRWQDVVREVEFIVVTRPGHQYLSPPGARVHRLETVALPVSSSEIRAALARGETPAELPKAVLEYIRANGLYRGS